MHACMHARIQTHTHAHTHARTHMRATLFSCDVISSSQSPSTLPGDSGTHTDRSWGRGVAAALHTCFMMPPHVAHTTLHCTRRGGELTSRRASFTSAVTSPAHRTGPPGQGLHYGTLHPPPVTPTLSPGRAGTWRGSHRLRLLFTSADPVPDLSHSWGPHRPQRQSRCPGTW